MSLVEVRIADSQPETVSREEEVITQLWMRTRASYWERIAMRRFEVKEPFWFSVCFDASKEKEAEGA